MEDRSKYEKITDDIMIIANKVLLRMNVGLSSYINDNRINYHKEVEYYSQKTNSNLINIKRHFDYYLSIEHIVNKDYIRIGLSDIIKLQHALNEAYKFFTDRAYQNLYVKHDGELLIYMKVDPIVITGLSMDKFLAFEPSVLVNYRGEQERALRMYLSSNNVYCDMTINKLEAFIYIINSINLFESAQLMLNYFQRPEFGYKLYSVNNEPICDEEDINFKGKDGREIQPKKNLSYFDRMKQLE